MNEDAQQEATGLETGGIAGEFKGRVYPLVVGLKQGPAAMHYFSEGSSWIDEGTWIIVTEANGSKQHYMKDNVSFICEPMFVIQDK